MPNRTSIHLPSDYYTNARRKRYDRSFASLRRVTVVLRTHMGSNPPPCAVKLSQDTASVAAPCLASLVKNDSPGQVIHRTRSEVRPAPEDNGGAASLNTSTELETASRYEKSSVRYVETRRDGTCMWFLERYRARLGLRYLGRVYLWTQKRDVLNGI